MYKIVNSIASKMYCRDQVGGVPTLFRMGCFCCAITNMMKVTKHREA